MDDNELNARRRGLMAAIGILLANAEGTAKTEILAILDSVGPDLTLKITDQTFINAATDAGVNPCPNGWHWNPILGMCVPD